MREAYPFYRAHCGGVSATTVQEAHRLAHMQRLPRIDRISLPHKRCVGRRTIRDQGLAERIVEVLGQATLVDPTLTGKLEDELAR